MNLQLLKLYFYKLKGYLKRSNSKSISKTSYLASGVQIIGLDNIFIGKYCTIGENTLFTINNREDGGIKLKIGDNTYIGRNNFFTVGKGMEVGEYCIIGNSCSFISADHHFDTPLHPYALSGASNHKVIKLGANCWLGNNVTIVGNVTVGHGAIIGAGSVVTKNIPPFNMAVGNPAKVIKKFSFALAEWVNGDDIPDSIYDNEDVYLEYLKKNFENVQIDYHSSTSKYGDI